MPQHVHTPVLENDYEKGIVGLPEELWHLFWDYSLDQLSLEQDRHTIVLRLLQSGGEHAIHWLCSSVEADYLRTLLIRRRGRGIDPKRLRFWGLMLRLPEEQVDSWIEDQHHNPWYNRIRR